MTFIDLNLQTLSGFSAPCPYLLDDIEFCFHLNSIFRLLPSKTCTMKKLKTLKKRWRTIQSQLRQGKRRYCVKFNESLRNLGGFALYTVCRSDFSVAYGGENYINRRCIRDMWILRKDKKLTDSGASSATANLDQKVVKTKLIFSGFLFEHELPLTTADHAAKLFRHMFPDSKIVNKY